MTITPSDETTARQSPSQRLTPQQRAQLTQALERLQADLQAIQAKQHAQTAGSPPPGGELGTP
jgi:hypothetical protein